MTAPRVLPLRIAPLPGESLDSWLEALARRNGLPLRALLAVLNLPRVITTRQLVTALNPRALRQLEGLTGLPFGRLDSAVLGADAPLGPQRQPRCRFCPRCLTERDGRWLLRWWLPWNFACTTHRLLLHDVCPCCHTAPRRLLPRRTHLHPPGSCLHKCQGQRVCGADLRAASPLRLQSGHPLLASQDWIDALLAGHDTTDTRTVFTDLNACTIWLLHTINDDDLHGMGEGILAGWHQQPPSTPGTRLQPLSASVRAVLVHTARPLLADGNDHEAISIIRKLRQRHDTKGSPAPGGMDFHPWRRLSPRAHRRFLRAAGPDMRVMDRLRLRTPTPRAGYPDSGHQPAERSRHLPQLLWPGWTVRLMPHQGTEENYFRAMASALLLLPGEPQLSPREITARLHPHLSDTMPVILRRATRHHPHVLTALCLLAEHLDDHGSPINYARRRDLIPHEPISYDTWKQLCFDTGTQPGERRTGASQTPRFVQVQRYLHQLLTGSDLSDPTYPLAWRSPGDRSRYLQFLPTLTLAQRTALHDHAQTLLAELNLNEPLTWEPSENCTTGLDLPGRSLNDIDLDALQRIVLTEQRAPRAAARELGTTLTHVRFALERVSPKPRPWDNSHSPLSSWRLRERARSIFTPDFFDREYTQQGKSLTQIARETDIPRHIVAEQADAIGLTIYYSRHPRVIDQDWLREQYLAHHRSTDAIAQQIGTKDETIRRRLQQLDIPLRPQGVHSQTVMLAKLDKTIPRDIRAAVEGTLHGWLRLHRFHIAMAFPNLTTAGAYLGTTQTALTTQFQRLEDDTGHTLYHRSVQTTPQRPTKRGTSLLRDIQKPDVQKLMTDALSPTRILPLPDTSTIAEAQTTARHRHKRGPLKPFDGIAVERLRIRKETLTLLQHLLDEADEEFYGAQVHARTGLTHGSVSDQLRRLRQAGWLTSRPEDDDSWMRRATPGRGPGRRILYYSLTPEGRRAAAHELHTRGFTAPRNSTDRWDKTTDKTSRHSLKPAGHTDRGRQK